VAAAFPQGVKHCGDHAPHERANKESQVLGNFVDEHSQRYEDPQAECQPEQRQGSGQNERAEFCALELLDCFLPEIPQGQQAIGEHSGEDYAAESHESAYEAVERGGRGVDRGGEKKG